MWGVVQRAIACAALLAVAAPGLLLWLPVWTYVQRQERRLLAKGPRWNDSVAEMKMMVRIPPSNGRRASTVPSPPHARPAPVLT